MAAEGEVNEGLVDMKAGGADGCCRGIPCLQVISCREHWQQSGALIYPLWIETSWN